MKLPSNDAFITGYSWNHFTTVLAQEIPELNARYVELVHEKTGATILHIQNEDPENLFCLSFRTLPPSSNGVAHILEHTVLCGSNRYPVRDPFFSMTRRSLNTFMNALTGSDFTCYPAASLVEKDFYNLLEVYLDSVFFPRLDRLSFLQEAHRLEFEREDDPKTPLVRKGVVYNEMKGSLSSPMTRLSEKLSALLFRDVPYGYNSGGDPKDIPSLTLEELKQFHQSSYHPSRCLFYFYGSFSLANHLRHLEEHVLKKSSRLPPLPPLPLQPRFRKPVFEECEYPSADTPLEYGAMSWLTYPCSDIKKMISLSVLDSLLMSTDASPLKRKILSSSLAQQAYSSLQIEQREASFSLIMTGTKRSKEEIHKAIFQFLEEIERDGFQKKEIERALHELELERKEISREGAPFGLNLFWRSGLLKQQGIDPLSGLETERYFQELHEEIRRHPRYFSTLLSNAFLDNHHLVVVRMVPSKRLEEHEKKEERKELDTIQHSLTSSEKKALLKQARELHAFQEKEEDLSCLPTIQIKDISKKNRLYTVETDMVGTQKCFFSHAFTNHIVYIDLALPLPLPLFQKPHILKLFTTLFPQMGYGPYSWKEALERTQEYTGGIACSLSLNPSIYDPNTIDPYLYLQGSALSKNLEHLLEIMAGYLQEAKLDDQARFDELMKKHIASLEASLIPSSLRYASLEAEKNLSLPGSLQWRLSGRSYLEQMRLVSSPHQEEDMLYALRSTQKKLRSSSPILIATCSPEEKERILRFLEKKPFSARKEQSKSTRLPKAIQEDKGCIALQSASPIAFTSLAMKAVPYAHPNAAAFKLLAPLLNNVSLHKAIREQGGAYGGGASYNASHGLFTFYSYRDPHICKSYLSFRHALQQAAKGHFEKEDLDEAKRECIQDMDEPLSPSSIAQVVFHRMVAGQTDALRQTFRTKLLKAAAHDVQQAALFLMEESFSKGSLATMAGASLLASEKGFFDQEGIPLSTIAI